jgi:hypothetical protein
MSSPSGVICLTNRLHREAPGTLPMGWLCVALGVSQGGFYAWLTLPRGQRRQSDDKLECAPASCAAI